MDYCTSCGSVQIEYLGVEDGGGDYGTSLVDTFRCHSCGYEFEAGIGYDYGEEEWLDDDYDYQEPSAIRQFFIPFEVKIIDPVKRFFRRLTNQQDEIPF